MIDFEAYSGDCLVFGHVDFGRGRLTDWLNAVTEVPITDVRLEDLGDGHRVELLDLTVGYDELCAVVATGPRGDPDRRVKTLATRVTTEVGPYVIEGDVHAPPAANPLGFTIRGWTPLTGVAIRYERNGQAVTDEVATLILNRKLAGKLHPL